jgi:hypothetical protein
MPIVQSSGLAAGDAGLTMPRYYLRTRRAEAPERSEAREFPDLNAAMAAANRKVRCILRRCRGRAETVRGAVDIEDDCHRQRARILFAEVQQQIS